MAWDHNLPVSVKPEHLLHDLFIREAQQKQLRLHCGTEQKIAPDHSHSAIEYTAIYDQHLPTTQKIANRWFSALFQQCVYRPS
jgi:hypothetical protein